MIRKTTQLLWLATCLVGVNYAHANIFEDLSPIILSEYIDKQKQNEQAKHTINLEAQNSNPAPNNQTIDLNLQPLESDEIAKTYLTLLPLIVDQAQQPTPKTCSLKDLQKLNVLTGTTSHPTHSLKHLFQTKTHVGNICKTIIFSAPTSDQATLEQRQQEVRFLLKNPELRTKIQTQLNIIAENERIFLNYFKVFSPVEEEALNAYYFKSAAFNSLNKSRLGLDSFYLCTRALTLLGFVPIQAWQRLTGEVALAYDQAGSLPKTLANAPEIIRNTCTKGFWDLVHQHNPRTNILTEQTDGNVFYPVPTGKEHISWGDIALGLEFKMTDGKKPQNPIKKVGIKTISKLLGILPAAYFDFGSARLAYLVFQENKRFASTLKNFHTKLHAAAQIIKAYKAIHNLIAETPLRYNNSLDDLFFTGNINLEQLIKTLETDRWINKGFSLATDWGQILATNKQLEAFKTQISLPLYEVGMLDTIVSAATTMDQALAENLPVSFALYDESSRPTLIATNFWNPLVATHKAVLNSIELLPENTRGLLFTGPNGSGKSTNTKGIIFNIILSQTLGIAFAQEFRIAPYHQIVAAFNEQEDVAQDLSSFMAEKLRIDSLCKTVANLTTGTRVFVFMDEAVKGTVEEAAGEIILDTCLKLAKQPEVNALVITHTQAPTQAEELTNGIFKNYFVEVLQPKTNEFVRTFVLKEGSAQWWFASPETRKAFIAFLSNEEEMKTATI